jgi:hypothetical protein
MTPPQSLQRTSRREADIKSQRTAAAARKHEVETRSPSWASRPDPRDIIGSLEEHFPGHDLDTPIVEAVAVEYSSTTRRETPTAASVRELTTAHKRSIRSIACERMSRHPAGSSDDSPKLWGSSMEELTPDQLGAGVMVGGVPDSSTAVARRRGF